MTHTLRPFVGYLLVPLLAALSFHSAANDQRQPTYRFCEDPWPPYTVGETSLPPKSGMAVELFEELEQRLGMTFHLRLLPWKRCLLWAKEGKYDGVMLLTRNEDRSRYLSFPVAVHQDANVVWALKSRTFERDFRTFKDFQGLRIGLTEGFNYGEAFDQAVEEYRLKVDSGPTVLSNMLRLALGRIDIFLVNRVVGESATEDRPSLREKLTYHRGPFEAVPFFIGLSKSSPIKAEVPRFNEALENMKQDGTINRIFGTQPP
ncbi:substrate-binding periplasmic protein [Marinobacter sp.]|uniref:substrate-binding periplasmic protein n=1 Tax=Marinobacter sp. TaxID=50741 RepID=UPI003B523EF6